MADINSRLPCLDKCLTAATWRHLLAVMRCQQLPCSERWSKGDLVMALQTHLTDPSLLKQLVADLPAAMGEGLRAVLGAGGQVPLAGFTALFGALRPYRPWRQDEPAFLPWLARLSVAEQLWYLGLVHLWPLGTAPEKATGVVMADEVYALFADLWATREAEATAVAWERPSCSPDLLWDVAMLLATAAAAPVRLLHGRWLPPRVLRRLARRLGLDERPGFVPSRSERKLPYVAFVHYVAEAAGLVSGGEYLTVSTRGWVWLAATRAVRWQQLWQGWGGMAVAVTERFGFAWAGVAVGWGELALTLGGVLSLAKERPLSEVVDIVCLRHRVAAREAVVALLTQACFWFGLVVVVGEAVAESDRLDREETAGGAEAEAGVQLRLTALGGWLWGRAGCGQPGFPEVEPCWQAPSLPEEIVVPVTAQPIHLVRLAAFCEWPLPGPGARGESLQLDEGRVGRCVAEGMPLVQILHDLETALERPLSRRQGQKLRRWARLAQRVRMRHVTMLETTEAALMGQLRSRKLVRRHLGAALAPTRSEVNPAGMGQLVRTLATLGHQVQPPPELSLGYGAEAGAVPEQVVLSTAEASLLLATAAIYRQLGAHVALPLRLSSDLVMRLRAQLSVGEQEAAEQLAAGVMGQLEGVLQGYLALPAWYEERDGHRADVVGVRRMVETAVAEQRDLVLTYQNRHEAAPLVRRVTPYWLEQRYGVLYLQAFCHLQEAERVFRVDRVVGCEVVEKER